MFAKDKPTKGHMMTLEEGLKNNTYLWIDYAVYTEDYYIIQELRGPYFDRWDLTDEETAKQSYITFINKETYKTEISIDLNQISMYQPKLFNIDNQSMLFYSEEESSVIEYNTKTGEIIRLAQFDNQTNFIDYDAEENCLYLKLNSGFSYKDNSEDNHESEYDYFLSTNIEIDDTESAKVIYLKYYLDNQSHEVIKSVSLNEYQMHNYTSKYMKYYRVNDFIYAYSYSTDYGYGNFCYKMRLE